jgi:hypothetical protein
LNDGSYALADRYDQDRYKRFSEGGEYLGHVGRRGKGPGEFEIVQFVNSVPGDSIEVYDLGLERITVFSPSHKVVRTVQQPVSAMEMVRLPNGWRVVSGHRFESDRVGLPLHTIDAEGNIVVSFGADPPVRDVRNAHLMYRQLTYGSTDSSVWSSHLTRYRLEEWSVRGNHMRSLERKTTWFVAHSHYGFDDRDNAPRPGLMAIYRDRDGILWTLSHVADDEWREGVGTRKDPYGRTRRGIVNRDAYYDTMIEAIDPSQRVVVGLLRMDEAARGFTSDGPVFGYDDTSNAEPVVPLWRVRLSGR